MYDEDTKTDLTISEGRTRNSVAYFKSIETLKSQMNENLINISTRKYEDLRGFRVLKKKKRTLHLSARPTVHALGNSATCF